MATGVLILQSLEVFFSYVLMSFQRIEKRLLNCSMGTRSHLASSAGKFETLGSNFSNETRICEAAGVLILQSLEVFFFYAFMSFPRTEKRLLIVVWALEAIRYKRQSKNVQKWEFKNVQFYSLNISFKR